MFQVACPVKFTLYPSLVHVTEIYMDKNEWKSIASTALQDQLIYFHYFFLLEARDLYL